MVVENPGLYRISYYSFHTCLRLASERKANNGAVQSMQVFFWILLEARGWMDDLMGLDLLQEYITRE